MISNKSSSARAKIKSSQNRASHIDVVEYAGETISKDQPYCHRRNYSKEEDN